MSTVEEWANPFNFFKYGRKSLNLAPNAEFTLGSHFPSTMRRQFVHSASVPGRRSMFWAGEKALGRIASWALKPVLSSGSYGYESSRAPPGIGDMRDQAIVASPTKHLGPFPRPEQDIDSAATVVRRKPPTLRSLQALRALAATTVLFVHIPCMGWGYFGVDIFFVLSGFIVCYISEFDADRFFLRRLFRVVPLYWAGTLGVFCLAALAPHLVSSTSTHPLYLLKSLFFVPYAREDGGVYPVLFLGWTLQYEMFFYLLFALALSFSRKIAGPIAILMLVSIASLGQILRPESVVLQYYSNNVILLFALGICGYLLWRRYNDWLRRGPIAIWAIAAALAYSAAWLLDIKVLIGHSRFLRTIPGFALHGMPALVICVAFLALEGRVRVPWTVLLIGDASYSLYLFHPYILEAINKEIFSLARLTPATVAVSLLGIFLCFACAILSYRFVELPSNRFLRNKFLKNKGELTAGVR
jgi:peptidoglycan/LPS O-acetylase OafA/YrhL